MQKYKRIKKISQGAFGTVYQYQTINQSEVLPKLVAIKQIFSSSANVQRQLDILRNLPIHPNLLKTYQIIQGESFHTNIVMQRGQYDLSLMIDKINRYPIPQQQVKKLAYQVLNGLVILHQQKLIHRDLKPGNLIVSKEGRVALCDFGSTVKCTQGQDYQLEGFTRWYKAPQMLYGSRNYQYEVDMWAVGCILMEYATGQPYFDGKSQIEQLSLMTRQLGNPNQQNWPAYFKLPDYGKINFKIMIQKTEQIISKERGISIELCRFIKKMVKYGTRSSAEQLLKDGFLLKINQENCLLEMPTVDEQALIGKIKSSVQKLKKQVKAEIKKC